MPSAASKKGRGVARGNRARRNLTWLVQKAQPGAILLPSLLDEKKLVQFREANADV